MIRFVSDPEPILTVYGINYKGISILETLDSILSSPNEHKSLSLSEVSHYFNMILQYHRQHIIPSLGFHLQDVNAVMPTKRIIDVGFDLTIISVAKVISKKITLYETGIALTIPIGFYVELVPCNSMIKTGYMLANSVGIIDPWMLSTVKVSLIKVDDSLPNIELPIKIVQLILKPYIYAHAYQVNPKEGIIRVKSSPIDIPNGKRMSR